MILALSLIHLIPMHARDVAQVQVLDPPAGQEGASVVLRKVALLAL